MIGDSRTQYIYKFLENSDWDSIHFLGQYRRDCSDGKTTIQNVGIGGSTIRDWKYIFDNGIMTKEKMHKRIVIMLGGNDVLRTTDKWRLSLNPDLEKEKILDEIHTNFKEVIQKLLDWDKEIIIQTHFLTSPRKKNAFHAAADEALLGLSKRILNDFGNVNEIPKIKNVSVAFIEPIFPAIFFIDKAHLNEFGFKAHSFFLQKELAKRCWW